MPYVALKNFSCPYGVFYEKKRMKFIKKPPKSVVKDWMKHQLVVHVPDSDDEENEPDEYDVPPPTAQEFTESGMTEEQMEALTNPDGTPTEVPAGTKSEGVDNPFARPPVPPRSSDMGGMHG